MKSKKRTAIIISASSDIGTAMCQRWISQDWNVLGTFKTKSMDVDQLVNKGVKLFYCDLLSEASVLEACSNLCNFSENWDALVLCPGIQEPIGLFTDCDFNEWRESVRVNFTNQLLIVHKLLSTRNQIDTLEPCVLFFAGGGTNNATVNYSAYTISKIALIKMCELLDAEIPDTRFAILGPGWVKTKIHQATLNAGKRAENNYEKTRYKLLSNECTPMNEVLDCCDWLINTPRQVISGRNFSVVFDMWGTKQLANYLKDDFNMYKLRRQGNDVFVRNKQPSRKKSEIFNKIISLLPTITNQHYPESPLYSLIKQVVRKEVEVLFNENDTIVEFEPFGELIFPYHSMGAVDSLNLFDLDELIIFSFYWVNRSKYRKVLDIGANLGLHSILLSKCGYEVTCYEPDPVHFSILKQNMELNNISKVKAYNSAVSNTSKEMEFVRVLGNTTGSHLAGAKANPYGKLERFPVKLESFKALIAKTDLVKIDAEGHEKEILLSTTLEDWEKTDALVEVENSENASAIYEHFTQLDIQLFAQKMGWQVVRNIEDMPTGYREGSLFISKKKEMPWNENAK